MLRRLFRHLFADFNRMTMIRHESSSVTERAQDQSIRHRDIFEDYSDRCSALHLTCLHRGGVGSRQVFMGTTCAISQIKATSSRATAVMVTCTDFPRMTRRR